MEPETFMTEIKETISSLVKTTEAAKGANAFMKNKIIGDVYKRQSALPPTIPDMTSINIIWMRLLMTRGSSLRS